MLKTYVTSKYSGSFFLNMILTVSLVGLSLIKPVEESFLLFFWFLVVFAIYVIWLKLENSILNKTFFLFFAPMCIFINLVGVQSATSYLNGITQYIQLNLIVVGLWCIVALVGDSGKVKPAMLIIEAILKTIAAAVAIVYLLKIDIAAESDTLRQLKVFLEVLSLPLVLAVIWGKLVLELKKQINNFIHRWLFSLFRKVWGNSIAIKILRTFRKFIKSYIINNI